MRYSKFMLAVAAAAFSTSAFAASPPVSPDRDATGKALILVPLTLTKVNDLDFGTVVTSSSAGTVDIDPTTGGRTVSGGVTAVTSDAGFRAVFAGAGSPNQLVTFTLTPPATLDDGLGNSMPVTLTLQSASATIDPTTRAFFIGVGGSISVAPDQPDGVYTGTFDLMAQYN